MLGDVYTWGDKSSYQPQLVPGIVGTKAIAAGKHFNAVVDLKGSLFVWGNNDKVINGREKFPKKVELDNKKVESVAACGNNMFAIVSKV